MHPRCTGDAAASSREAKWGYPRDVAPPRFGPQSLEIPLRLALDGCGEANDTFVRECFRGRHLLVIGDSVSRYQYLSLTQFLTHSSWVPFQGKGGPLSEVERVHGGVAQSWNGWNNFFVGTNARQGGFEICDCFRSGLSDMFQIENRYYYNPTIDVRVTFLLLQGANSTRHHDLDYLNVTCGVSSGCAQGGCQPGVSCGDSFGTQNYYRAEDGEQAQAAFLRRVVVDSARLLATRVAPIDALVFNLGFFGGPGWPREENLLSVPVHREVYKRTLVEVTAILQRERLVAQLIWKSTTATTNNDYQPSVELEWVRANLLPLGWELFDAFHLTQSLGELLWLSVTDGIHFKPHVYRGLNEALALQLCGAHGAHFHRPSPTQKD
jgi:hypothetical protein